MIPKNFLIPTVAINIKTPRWRERHACVPIKKITTYQSPNLEVFHQSDPDS
jgi:hypothetical protein